MSLAASALDKRLARRIIETVGAHGTPPEWGFQHFTVGLDAVLDVLDEDYLGGVVGDGGAAFKLVVGAYGGGKTHLLYCLRAIAWRRGFAVSYVSLHAEESPFHRLDRVYRAVALALTAPVAPDATAVAAERGLGAYLKGWYADLSRELTGRGLTGDAARDALSEVVAHALSRAESVNWSNAVREAMLALHRGDERAWAALLQWLVGDGFDRATHGPFGILQPIDRSAAFPALRSLVALVRARGHGGLVILFDEAEQVPSLSTRQKELMLANLRELVDECGQASFANVLVVYAVPSMAVFEGHAHVYEALKQRLASVFGVVNPTGVRIELAEQGGEHAQELLRAIGERLRGVYEAAYGARLPAERAATAVALVARAAYDERFGDVGYRRLFVQAVVRAFHQLRAEKRGAAGEGGATVHALLDDGWARKLVTSGATPDGEAIGRAEGLPIVTVDTRPAPQNVVTLADARARAPKAEAAPERPRGRDSFDSDDVSDEDDTDLF